MRFPSAYYLMLIYLTVMFKPFIPVVRDLYEHTFGEAIHLASVHAKYGSNHLDKALAKSGHGNDAQKSSGNTEPYSFHLGSSPRTSDIKFDNIDSRFFLKRLTKWSAIFLAILAPPPKD